MWIIHSGKIDKYMCLQLRKEKISKSRSHWKEQKSQRKWKIWIPDEKARNLKFEKEIKR